MKKYVITGSIGHISKPIVQGLVQAGKEVTVVTSNADKVKEIESLGAKGSVGSVNDAGFLAKAFRNAEVVYTMIPPNWQTDNFRASQNVVAKNYVEAIRSNAVKYVVNLSSAGAHLENGCGPVNGIHDFEQLLNQVEGLNVKHLRPSYFYYNLLTMIGMVKQAGIMGTNFGGGEQKIGLTHTNDIARVAIEELLGLKFRGNSVRYIYSDKRTGNEIVKVLGKAIEKEFPWVEFTDEQQLQGLLGAGLPQTHAENYTEMGTALRSGKMQEELFTFEPEAGSIKLENFATEFKQAFVAS